MNKRISIFLIIILMIVSIFGASNTFAASANASISGGGTVTKGETFTVTVTLSGHTFGSADLRFEYDASVLQYVKSSDGPPSASGVFNQSKENEEGVSSLTFTATFKAIGVGSGAIKVSALSCSNLDFELLNVSPLSTTVTVTNPEPTVSSNANLSALSVSSGRLSPAFSPSRTSYDVHVGSDVTVCTVSADAEDDKATISVSGSKNLSVGKNVRKVIVTAPSGNTKTYTLNIYRAEPSQSTTPNEDEQEENTEEENKEITATIDGKKYVVVENIKNELLPEKFNLVIGKFEGKDIPLVKDANLKYTLALLKNQTTGDEEWFFFDEENGTFAKNTAFSPEDVMNYVKLSANESPDEQNEEVNNSVTNTELMLFVLGGTLLLLIFAVILLQVKIIKGKKSKKKAN